MNTATKTERKREEKVKPTTTVCLPVSLLEELDRQAEIEELYSRSAIIRKACRRYLAEARQAEAATA